MERSCARCDRATNPVTGAVASYGPHDSTVPDTAALCSDCATLLTPVRLAVDLEQVRSITDPAATCREVGELVQRIVAMRAPPPPEIVWTRARDAHVLARRTGATRTHLTLRLRDLGILAATEVATNDPPGGARQTRTTYPALV